MRIAFVDGGTYYHHATAHDPELSACLSAVIYAPELVTTDLTGFDCLYVASRQDPSDLLAARPLFEAFLATGKTLVVMGDNDAQEWVPGVRWQATAVNFWWWLTPGADSGLRLAAPDHDLFRHITLADATWHRHGVLLPPEGAVSLIDAEEGGSVLYEHEPAGGGRLIVSTLDPCYHHGSYFMPSTTRFLKGFFPWLRATAAV